MNINYVLMLGLALTACQPKASSESKIYTAADSVLLLEKEVLAIHDSIMPHMSDLLRLKKAVSSQISETQNADIQANGLLISRKLEKADSAMMEWMNQYNGDTLKRLSPAQAIEYLNTQKIKVNSMGRLMQSSINDANAYLN